MDDLLSGSAIIRNQCRRLEQAPYIRLSLHLVTWPLECQCFGKTTVTSRAGGVLDARVHLRGPANLVDLAEMVAHEIEHVLEQVDGWDLRRLARRSRSGVREVGPEMFETERALAAGRTAAKELGAEADAGTPEAEPEPTD
jgi:hypothetical protein